MARIPRLKAVAVALVAVLALSGCGAERTDGADSAAPGGGVPASGELAQAAASSGDSWTFLFYGVLDNDLESFGLRDLEEMTGAVPTGDVEVIALVDRLDGSMGEGPDGPVSGVGEFTGAKLLRLADGGFEELADLGEIDIGDPQTLAWFVNTALTRFPADRTGLSLWDHGNGPFAFGADLGGAIVPEAGGGASIDATRITDFDAAEIVTGIESGLVGSGVDRLDLVIADACLMANFELANRMSSSVRYLLASEEVMPGDTFDYADLVGAMAADPSIDPVALSDVVQESYLRVATGYGVDAALTQSLIDLDALPALARSVGSLAVALEQAGPDALTAFGQARTRTLEFSPDPIEPALGTHLVDLGDLARQLAAPGLAPEAVAVAANGVFHAVDAAVVSQVLGSAMGQATGISIYAPVLAEHYSPTYDVVGDSGWRRFLAGYWEDAEDVPTSGAPAFVGGAQIESIDPSGVVYGAQLEPGTGDLVTEAYWETGVQFTDGTSGALLSGLATVGSYGPDTVAAGWGFQYLELSDGTTQAPLTVDLEQLEDGLRGFARVRYQSATRDEDVLLQLTLDPESGGVQTSALYAQVAGGGYAQLVPEAGATLLPLVRVYGAGGAAGEPLTDQPLRADAPLQTLVSFLPTGTSFYAGFLVADAAGNDDYTEVLGAVP